MIALDNPKSGANVGGAMRACGVYEAAMVVIAGGRFKSLKGSPADTMKAWKHIPVVEVDDVFDALPHDCVPIAVDMLDDAKPLPNYRHPERAFYIFGAEDATLGARITDRCRDKIIVPTKHCMNLAATVNVILYDRAAKRWGKAAGIARTNEIVRQS